MADLNDIDGLGPARSESLKNEGYESVEDLADADAEDVSEAAGVPEDTALSFVVQAQNYAEGDVDDAEVDADNTDAQDAPDPADLGEADENGSQTAENRDDDEVVDANADTSEKRGPDAESSESEEDVESAVEDVSDEEEEEDVVDAEADTSENRGPDAEAEEDEEEDGDDAYDGDREVADAGATTSANRGPDAEEDESDVSSQQDTGEDETYSLTIDLEDDIHNDAYMMALLNHRKRQHRGHAPSREAIDVALDDARYNDGTVEHELTESELNELHSAISQQINDFKGSNMLDHMDAAQDVQDQVNEVREEELF